MPWKGKFCVTHSVVQRQFKPVSPWVAQVLLWHCPQLCVSTLFPVCLLLQQLNVKLVEGAVCKRESLLAMVLLGYVETRAVMRRVTQQLRGPSEWNRGPERRWNGSEARAEAIGERSRTEEKERTYKAL